MSFQRKSSSTTPGVEGRRRTIKTRVYSNGQEIDRQKLSNEETMKTVTQIVKVSTAKPTMVPEVMHRKQKLCQSIPQHTDEMGWEK